VASNALLALAAATTPAAPSPALLDALEAVLAQDSATRALEQWCAARRIAEPPVVRAQKRDIAPEAHQQAPDRLHRRLGVGPEEAIRLRHVHLTCGATTLSIAWNWYVPARLTAAMNEALDGSDVPFGKVVAPLRFRREALPAVRGAADGCPPDTVITHRARLVLPDRRPLAFVIECYTAANLAK